MDKNRLARKFAMKNTEKQDIFHSSGYAKIQSGDNMGTAGVSQATQSFEERMALDEQRKYIKKYNNARIMSGIYGVQRATSFTPRTMGGAGSLMGGQEGYRRGGRTGGSSSGTSGGGVDDGRKRGANVSGGSNGGARGGAVSGTSGGGMSSGKGMRSLRPSFRPSWGK